MPDSNVTINPQYKKIETKSSLSNPNTKRNILLIAIIIMIIATITISIIKKEKIKA